MTPGNPKSLRILLVDDFELVRVMLRNTLRDLGFTNVEEAANGKNALGKLRESHTASDPFHLVFCDWNMPEMSGIELLEMCRKEIEFKDLPFIMVTAEADQKQVFRALTNGASDYIVKPVSPATLEKKIQRIIQKMQKQAAA